MDIFWNCTIKYKFPSLNTDSNEETAAQVRALGKVAHAFVCDCSSKGDVYRVAAKVQREVGEVDILVNNAGIASGRKLMNLKDVDIERTISINTLAHFWVSQLLKTVPIFVTAHMFCASRKASITLDACAKGICSLKMTSSTSRPSAGLKCKKISVATESY